MSKYQLSKSRRGTPFHSLRRMPNLYPFATAPAISYGLSANASCSCMSAPSLHLRAQQRLEPTPVGGVFHPLPIEHSPVSAAEHALHKALVQRVSEVACHELAHRCVAVQLGKGRRDGTLVVFA